MDLPKFSPRIVELIKSGVITVDIHLARDGFSVLARATQPHPRLGVRASTTYTLEEIVDVLSKVKCQQGSATSPNREKIKDTETYSPRGVHFPLVGDKFAAPSSVTRYGVRNELPSKSLCFMDFTLSDVQFAGRAQVVADNLGSAKLVSRITTARDVLDVSGASNLEEWWMKATPFQRWFLLSSSKKAGTAPSGCSYAALGEGHTRMLKSLSCPFRDARAQVYQTTPHPKDVPRRDADSEEESDGGTRYYC